MMTSTRLSDHLFLANIQLLFWLIFRPSVWRDYINRIEPTLSPDFALADLPAHCQDHSELKRLKLIAFIVQPFCLSVLISLTLIIINLGLWFFIEQWPQIASFISNFINQLFSIIPGLSSNLSTETAPQSATQTGTQFIIPFKSMILGISYGTVLGLIASIISSFMISMGFGLVIGAVGGLFTGLLFGVPGTTGVIAGIWVGIFLVSFASSILISLPANLEKQRLGRQIGAIVMSLSIGGVLLVLGSTFGGTLGSLLQKLPLINITIAQAQIIGMAAAAGFLVGWRLKNKWRWMPTLALFFASMIWFLISVIFHIVELEQAGLFKQFMAGFTGGAVNAILFAILFAIPYTLAKYIAGIEAGIMAGILGCAVTYLSFAIIVNPNDLFLLLGWSFVALVLGLSYQKWLPIILYPVTLAWNYSLYLAQKRHPKRSAILLQRHSAFWDEHQFLPLWGLEKQLTAMYAHDATAVNQAMSDLMAGKQSWAVESAQITLDLKSFAQCKSIEKIGTCFQTLLTSEQLPGATGEWLNRFRKMSQDVDAALTQQGHHQQHAMLGAVLGQLQGLALGADEQRFRTISAQWQGIVAKYADELLSMRELPNPYTFGPPINKKYHDVFVERPDVLTRLKQFLQAYHCPPLLLYGQRRTGKTSLLINLNHLLPSTFVMFFVDCQGPVALSRDHTSFFYNLARTMEDVKDNYPDLELPPLEEDILRTDPFRHFDEWLDQIEEMTGDKTLLLALDEFVTIDEAFDEQLLQPKAILGMFRHIIQHRPRFRLLFAGTHTFVELQHWASYFINVQTVHIGYLSDNEARQLIEQPVKYFPLRYTPEATQRILAITRAHPALIQLLCGELMQLKNGQNVDKRLKVEVDDVENAAEQALRHGAFFFADIEQNQADDTGRAVLRFIASHDEGVFVSRNDLQKQLATNLDSTLTGLMQRELLEKQNDGYRFQVEMIRQWFIKPLFPEEF